MNNPFSPVLSRLPPMSRPSYARHRAFVLFDSARAGIVSNVAVIALRAFHGPSWGPGLQLAMGGFGMIAALYLSTLMGGRRKMPFVIVPGFCAVAAVAAMAVTTSGMLLFALLGVLQIQEAVVMPAMASIIRANYPADRRGLVTGSLRAVASGIYLSTAVGSSWLLDHVPKWVPGAWMIHSQLALAASLMLVALLIFRGIRVRHERQHERRTELHIGDSLRAAIMPVRREPEFLRYLVGCLLFGFAAIFYVTVVPPYLSQDLGFGYTRCALLINVIPAAVSLLTSRALGAWFDRESPLVAWAWVRLGFAMEALLTSLASLLPGLAFSVVAAGRVCRGLTQTGNTVLGTQIGTNYFAQRKQDTALYDGINLGLTGLPRLFAPAAAVWFASFYSRRLTLLVGGLLALLAAAHAWAQARSQHKSGALRTFAERESQWTMAEVDADAE